VFTTIGVMSLAVALMAHRSLSFALYAATLDGFSIETLASEFGWPVHQVRERIDAVRMALSHQVRLDVDFKQEKPAVRQFCC
jgi:hypothetical protein